MLFNQLAVNAGSVLFCSHFASSDSKSNNMYSERNKTFSFDDDETFLLKQFQIYQKWILVN